MVARKLVHMSIGSVVILCWPMWVLIIHISSGHRGAILAALVPGINIVQVLLVGSGIWKDEAIVKFMRELLKGPLYYATTITLASAYYWRTSPVAITAICNMCAGDGLTDIVGGRFGHHTSNKSWAGSIAMAVAGFLASLGYMFYFSSFGFVQETWEMAFGFFETSLAAALVESLPINSKLDDNLTVSLTSIVVGSLLL